MSVKTAAGAGDFSRRVVDISQNKEKLIGIKVVNLIKYPRTMFHGIFDLTMVTNVIKRFQVVFHICFFCGRRAFPTG